ncbi:MAG: efflux RND transporter periplasmic adaptor subunit [Desulfobacterales bacterium]
MMESQDKKDISEVLSLEQPHRWWRKAVFIVFILLGISAGVLWKFWSPSEAKMPARFETEPVRQGRLKVTVSATGTLKPVNQVDVGTEVSGIIREVLVDFNDAVKKGQILARLDASKLQAQKLQSEASLEVAKAEYVKAQTDVANAKSILERLKRAFRLSNGKVPAKQDMDTAETNCQVTLAQVEVARANISKAKAVLDANISELEKATIYSPITGIVLNRSVEEGQTVAASLQAPVLFTLAENLANMMLYVSVDEADVGQIKEGQSAEFIVDAYPNKTFPAQITQVRFAPQTENGVVTYQCLLKVDNSELLLRPGMTATADILVHDEQDALLVPNAALRFTPSQSQVSSSNRGRQDADRKGQSSILSKLFPRRPRGRRGSRSNADVVKPDATRVWIVENGRSVPVSVQTGASDGIHTRIVSGDLTAGSQVIVGMLQEAK